MKRFVLIILFSVLGFTATPCGPFFPNSHIVYGGRDLLDMPEAVMQYEMKAALEELNIVPATAAEPEERHNSNDFEGLAAKTRQQDQKDIEEALAGFREASALCKEYDEFRSAMATRINTGVEFHGEFGITHPVHPPFDMALYESLLAKLPEEFSLYAQGAAAYYKKDYPTANLRFSALLSLPPDKRPYRSTWAAFMLGKVRIRMEQPEKAIPFFEQTRQLAGEGFRDPLDLAGDSLGWQARAEADIGAYAQAIRRYCDLYRIPKYSDMALGSLKWACQHALFANKLDPALTADPVCRRLLAAALVYRAGSEGKSSEAKRWLDTLAALDTASSMPGADRLAWAAYYAGDMERAAQWAARSDPSAPYASWVRAKLLLREGKTEEGASILRHLYQTFPQGDIWWVDDGGYDPVSTKEFISSDYGIVMLAQGDLNTALEAFLRSDSWGDAAFVAERVMLTKEFERFVQEHGQDPALQKKAEIFCYDDCIDSNLTAIRYVLARRLAREGAWDRAADYYPTCAEHSNHGEGPERIENLAEQCRAVSRHLAEAADAHLSNHERAQHYFDAATILRKNGMELTGTELNPDWRLYYGLIDPGDDQSSTNHLGEDFPSYFSIKGRLNVNRIVPNRRFHYRYLAADLMWECASLLPDNDVFTARALFLGGTYLKNRDPEAADRFYKALVRRNPNLLIAQQAAKLRWFPKEFTDTVLYQPIVYHTPKKRIAAYILVAVFGLFVVLFSFYSFRRLQRGETNPTGE